MANMPIEPEKWSAQVPEMGSQQVSQTCRPSTNTSRKWTPREPEKWTPRESGKWTQKNSERGRPAAPRKWVQKEPNSRNQNEPKKWISKNNQNNWNSNDAEKNKPRGPGKWVPREQNKWKPKQQMIKAPAEPTKFLSDESEKENPLEPETPVAESRSKELESLALSKFPGEQEKLEGVFARMKALKGFADSLNVPLTFTMDLSRDVFTTPVDSRFETLTILETPNPGPTQLLLPSPALVDIDGGNEDNGIGEHSMIPQQLSTSLSVYSPVEKGDNDGSDPTPPQMPSTEPASVSVSVDASEVKEDNIKSDAEPPQPPLEVVGNIEEKGENVGSIPEPPPLPALFPSYTSSQAKGSDGTGNDLQTPEIPSSSLRADPVDRCNGATNEGGGEDEEVSLLFEAYDSLKTSGWVTVPKENENVQKTSASSIGEKKIPYGVRARKFSHFLCKSPTAPEKTPK